MILHTLLTYRVNNPFCSNELGDTHTLLSYRVNNPFCSNELGDTHTLLSYRVNNPFCSNELGETHTLLSNRVNNPLGQTLPLCIWARCPFKRTCKLQLCLFPRLSIPQPMSRLYPYIGARVPRQRWATIQLVTVRIWTLCFVCLGADSVPSQPTRPLRWEP